MNPVPLAAKHSFPHAYGRSHSMVLAGVHVQLASFHVFSWYVRYEPSSTSHGGQLLSQSTPASVWSIQRCHFSVCCFYSHRRVLRPDERRLAFQWCGLFRCGGACGVSIFCSFSCTFFPPCCLFRSMPGWQTAPFQSASSLSKLSKFYALTLYC